MRTLRKRERTALTLEKVKGIWALIPRMPGQQQVHRLPLVCLYILAKRIQEHPEAAPPPTHWCTATNEQGLQTVGHLTPVRTASSLHLQEHDQPILLEGRLGTIYRATSELGYWLTHLQGCTLEIKMRLSPLHCTTDCPSQNSLGAQTFRDNSLEARTSQHSSLHPTT